jgi:integrase
MAAYLRLAIELPRRREELCEMRWEDYNGVQITLYDTKDKHRVRNETIPVPAPAAAIIDKLPKIDARIFPYNPESVSAGFQRACNRLGIEDLHLHDLRHEGISRLFAQGLEIQEVSLISGHRSWATLKRYTHLKPSDVLEKLNARSKKTQEAADKQS